MSISNDLTQNYTFLLCIDQGDRTLADTTFEVPATVEGIAKARRTIRHLMNEYAPVIKDPEATTNTVQKQDDQSEAPSAPPPEKKPEGARGLLRLRCPECGNTFGTFLREYQTEVACKCGHQIDLTRQLGQYHSTCPYCQHESWGKTNLEDPEITVRCKCGEDVELRWEPREREYQN